MTWPRLDTAANLFTIATGLIAFGFALWIMVPVALRIVLRRFGSWPIRIDVALINRRDSSMFDAVIDIIPAPLTWHPHKKIRIQRLMADLRISGRSREFVLGADELAAYNPIEGYTSIVIPAKVNLGGTRFSSVMVHGTYGSKRFTVFFRDERRLEHESERSIHPSLHSAFDLENELRRNAASFPYEWPDDTRADEEEEPNPPGASE